jgi:hypothetical protein
MLLQEICHRLGLMKFGLSQWCSAVEVGSVDVSAVSDQQFRNCSLVGMSGSMQWRSTPMVIVVAGINVSAELQ